MYGCWFDFFAFGLAWGYLGGDRRGCFGLFRLICGSTVSTRLLTTCTKLVFYKKNAEFSIFLMLTCPLSALDWGKDE